MDLIYGAPPRPGLVGPRPVPISQFWQYSQVLDVRYSDTVLQ